MGTLRWILLVLGIVVIAVVYFRGRRQKGPIWPRREPRLDLNKPSEPPASLEADETAVEPDEPPDESEHMDFDEEIVRGLEKEVDEAASKTAQVPASAERPASSATTGAGTGQAPTMLLDEELVVLHIIAPRGSEFDGRELYFALHQSGFEKRRGDVFYCYGEAGEYMAVNALKPGTFPEDPADLSTRAIGLILRLSGCEKPLTAFDEFLELVRRINSQLDGHLCDSRRSSLTPQTIGYLRDEVQQYQIKHLKARANR